MAHLEERLQVAGLSEKERDEIDKEVEAQVSMDRVVRMTDAITTTTSEKEIRAIISIAAWTPGQPEMYWVRVKRIHELLDSKTKTLYFTDTKCQTVNQDQIIVYQGGKIYCSLPDWVIETGELYKFLELDKEISSTGLIRAVF